MFVLLPIGETHEPLAQQSRSTQILNLASGSRGGVRKFAKSSSDQPLDDQRNLQTDIPRAKQEDSQ